MGWNTQLARPIAIHQSGSATLRTMAEASHFLFESAASDCDCMTIARGAVCDAVLTEREEDVLRATAAVETALNCKSARD